MCFTFHQPLDTSRQSKVKGHITTSGVLTAVVFWFELQMTESAILTSKPSSDITVSLEKMNEKIVFMKTTRMLVVLFEVLDTPLPFHSSQPLSLLFKGFY